MKKLILFLLISVDMFSVTNADGVQAPSGPYRSLVVAQKEPLSGITNSSPEVGSKALVSSREVNRLADHERNNQRQTNIQQWINNQNHQPSAHWGNQMYAQPEVPVWLKQQGIEQKSLQKHNKQQQLNVHERNTQQGGYHDHTQQYQGFKYQPAVPLNNRNQRYFPAARGHIYGPEKVPPEFYSNPSQQQPVYQARRPVYQYPPMWK